MSENLHVGDRVNVLSLRMRGTVTALDLPGRPRGVAVDLDYPVSRLSTCYATYAECWKLRPVAARGGCAEEDPT